MIGKVINLIVIKTFFHRCCKKGFRITNDSKCRNSSSLEQTSGNMTNCPSKEWESFYLTEDNSTRKRLQLKSKIFPNEQGIAVLESWRDPERKKKVEINSTPYCVSKVCKD